MQKNQIEVMLVEPDNGLAKSYVNALQTRHIRTIREANAEKAISMIDKVMPKVIILELQLKGHNGIEFLHELRSYADWQHIKVVVLSVVPESESGISQEVRYQMNISDYCYKPATTIVQLCNIVKGLIS